MTLWAQSRQTKKAVPLTSTALSREAALENFDANVAFFLRLSGHYMLAILSVIRSRRSRIVG